MLSESQRFGRYAESLAVKYLKKNGYRILTKNYRNRYGEIDIVAQCGETIVFVEVKARSSKRFGNAKEAVTADKQRKISMVALGYLKQMRKTAAKARFDVVCVEGVGPQMAIEIIPNAFPLAYG